MKKVFAVLIAVLFLVSFSFSQNTTTVNQTGDQNNAPVTQAGNNTATVTQTSSTGLNNTPFYNEAFIDQTGNHTATVTQNTFGKDAQYYYGNYADIDQTGAGQSNTATVLQEGSNKQTLNGITRGAYIMQDGDGNDATVEQRGTGNTAIVNQYGTNNSASHIILGFAPGNTRTNNITGRIDQVDPSGFGNTATQFIDPSAQNGELRSSSLTIYQDGSENTAEQRMIVAWGKAGSMSAHQYGNQNEALQVIDDNNSGGNALTIEQGSNLEDSDGNVAEQYSYGNNNTASITQHADGSVGSYVNNEAYQTMYSGGNSYTIMQTGVDNYATQTANSGANISTVTQTGNQNTAVVDQTVQ